jgi:hypothetical protein
VSPSRNRKRAGIAAILTLVLEGCFFDRVQRSEEDDIQRVEQKQATLQTEQYRAAVLDQKEEQLANEMGVRELSLQELNDRIERINADNGREISNNEAKRLQYQALLAQLHETNQRLSSLQQGDPIHLEQQRDQIADLKTRLREQLDLLLR